MINKYNLSRSIKYKPPCSTHTLLEIPAYWTPPGDPLVKKIHKDGNTFNTITVQYVVTWGIAGCKSLRHIKACIQHLSNLSKTPSFAALCTAKLVQNSGNGGGGVAGLAGRIMGAPLLRLAQARLTRGPCPTRASRAQPQNHSAGTVLK